MARAHPKPDHVRVRVLGASEITVGSRRVGMSTEALFALALFVTTRAGERLTRAEVLETFWPGSEEEARRHALRQMLYRLRQKGFRFAEEGEHLCLEAELVDSDVRACTSASWPESASAEAVEAALTLGPTFSARLPGTFLEWFEGVRAAVSHQARKAAFRWIATSRMQGRWAELERWSRAVLRVDPLNEEATLALAEAASMLGSKTLALEILDGYLAEVSGPDASVGKPAQILRKRIAERRASWLPSGPREVALIGRAEEMSVLTQAIEASLGGQSRSVLLVGPSGYGKSRLLAEAREYAALRGVRCVGVRADSALSLHPMALVRSLARELESQPGAAAVDPKAMRTLRQLTKEDASGEPSIVTTPVTTPSDVRSCLVELVQAISHESKLLITLDDLHCSDDLSVDILIGLLALVRSPRCTLVGAAETHILARIPKDSSARGVRRLMLPPLSDQDSHSLALATAVAHQRTIGPDVLGRIARRSGGHPQFARELTLSTIQGAAQDALPASLADLVARSLAAQPHHATKVLRVISLLEESATVQRVRHISGIQVEEFLEVIENLASDGIVQCDDSKILRVHDSWRDAILMSSPAPATAVLALECASCLAASAEALAPSVGPRIASLYRIAGETDASLRYALSGIDGLSTAGLFETALHAIDIASSEAHGALAKSRLLVRKAIAHLASGHPELALPLADSVWRSRVLQAHDTISEHVSAVCVSADSHIKLDRSNTGPAAELLGIARNSALTANERARACLWGIRMVSNASGVRDFSEFASIALSLGDKTPASAHAGLALLIYAAENGTSEAIDGAYERIRRVEQRELSVGDRCLLLRCTAQALRIAGDLGEASATAQLAYDFAHSHRMSHAAKLAAELLCNLYLDFGLHEQARNWYDRLTLEAGIASTASSADHTRDRLDYLDGKLGALTERLPERLLTIQSLGHTHGRASELALAGAILFHADRKDEARDLILKALSATAPFVGRQAADFALDTCLSVAAQCGLDMEVKALGARHVTARTKLRGLSFAPAFVQLRSLPVD